MKIITKIINELGTFESDVLEVTTDEFNLMVESSKGFWYTEPSFYLWTKKGVAVFPPEIACKSILLIEEIKENGSDSRRKGT